MNKDNKIKKIVLTAMLSAIICITTMIFHIPIGFNGAYIHLGDTFIFLAAVILPKPYAMIAAILGAGLADFLSGGIVWIIPTIIIKPIMVAFLTSKNKDLLCRRNIFLVFIAGFIGSIGYYLAGAIMVGSFITPLPSFFLDLIQPISSGIIFLGIGYALDKINIREKIYS